MEFLNSFLEARLPFGEKTKELDNWFLGTAFDVNLFQRLKAWAMKRVELHVIYENIPLSKKDEMRLGCKVALKLISQFPTNQHNYDYFLSALYSFVAEVMSIPSILRYLMPILKEMNLQPRLFKDLF